MNIMDVIKDWFVHVKRADWKRIGTVLSALVVAWVFLQGVVPEPWHDYVAGILAFLSTFIATLLKAEKLKSGGSAC